MHKRLGSSLSKTLMVRAKEAKIKFKEEVKINKTWQG
jgi:hypothetical protein